MTTQLVSSCLNIDNFRSSNIVAIVRWEGEISLNDAFRCLPIFSINEVPIIKGKKGKKIKIPYYGVEDVIISIRHKKECRGLRTILNTKQDNFVSVDLQTEGKNVHIKLSETNATVTGVTTLEQGLNSIQCLLDLIHQTDENLEYLRTSLSKEVDKCENFINNFFIDDKTKGIDIPDYDVVIEKINEHNNVHLDENKIDIKLCEILLAYAYESKNKSHFSDIISNITQSNKIDKDKVVQTIFDVSTSLYNYHLSNQNDETKSKMKGMFLFKELANSINDLKDPHVLADNHNWNSKYCNVAISDDVIDCKGNIIQKIHRFNISEHGGVRQWSPDIKESSYQIHNKLIKIIRQAMKNNPNIFFPDEQIPKSKVKN